MEGKLSELDSLVAERLQQLVTRWDLEQHIKDISEFFGESHVMLIHSDNPYSSTDWWGFGSSTLNEIVKSTTKLKGDTKGLGILIYSGNYPGTEGDGKAIKFLELDRRTLLVAPGINWAIDTCPIISDPSQIKEAYLSVFERNMEKWRIARREDYSSM